MNVGAACRWRPDRAVPANLFGASTDVRQTTVASIVDRDAVAVVGDVYGEFIGNRDPHGQAGPTRVTDSIAARLILAMRTGGDVEHGSDIGAGFP